MPVDRYIITDRQWAKIEPHCLGKKSDPGRTGGDARLFLEGVFWIARTGAQWYPPVPVRGSMHTAAAHMSSIWVRANPSAGPARKNGLPLR